MIYKRKVKLKIKKEENKMLTNKRRDNINSSGSNNSSTFDTSRSKHKSSSKQ